MKLYECSKRRPFQTDKWAVQSTTCQWIGTHGGWCAQQCIHWGENQKTVHEIFDQSIWLLFAFAFSCNQSKIWINFKVFFNYPPNEKDILKNYVSLSTLWPGGNIQPPRILRVVGLFYHWVKYSWNSFCNYTECNWLYLTNMASAYDIRKAQSSSPNSSSLIFGLPGD